MKLTLQKPLPLFIPIQRFEERPDGHIMAHGYCFVNPKCGDGWNLKRSAMEGATADFAQWGAIREMHGPNAAGTTTAEGAGVEWDDKGCFVRALIVDEGAKEKCRTKVYKGFSVGVTDIVARGRDVERCKWKEVSLVDRPADPDALFQIARAEGADGPVEIDIQEEAETTPLSLIRAAIADPEAATELKNFFNAQWGSNLSRLDLIVADVAKVPAQIEQSMKPVIERVKAIEDRPAGVTLPMKFDMKAVSRGESEGDKDKVTDPRQLIINRMAEIGIELDKTPLAQEETRLNLISERGACRMKLAALGYTG